MTRILMVAERLEPAIGGVERHVAGLARALVAAGHRVTLVAPAHRGNLEAREELGEGLVLHRIPVSPRRALRYPGAWRWWRRHRHLLESAEVVHVHGAYALLGWLGPSIRLARRARLGLTVHGYEMCWPVPRKAKFMRRLAARLSDGVLIVGDYLEILFHLDADVSIPGAVDLPAVTEGPVDGPIVVLARLDADTRLDLAISALAKLRDLGLEPGLVIYGEGPHRSALEAQAAGLGLDVELRGVTADPSKVLAGAGLVFASGWLATLEAMAARRPLVAIAPPPVKNRYFAHRGTEELFPRAADAEQLATEAAKALRGEDSERLDAARAYAASWSFEELARVHIRLWRTA